MEDEPRQPQPRMEKAPQLTTSERPPIQTPQAFISDVRRSILGDNPDAQRVAEFEQSMAGRAFGVAERYFQLQALEQQHPFLQHRYVGTASIHALSYELGNRHVSVNVGGQYRVGVNENGTIDLDPPIYGGDDSLLYHTPDQAGVGVRIDAKTGAVTVMGAGENQVSPETQTRLNIMLNTTNAYYDEFQRRLPLVESYRQARGGMPDGLFPRFPTAEIRQLRLGKA